MAARLATLGALGAEGSVTRRRAALLLWAVDQCRLLSVG